MKKNVMRRSLALVLAIEGIQTLFFKKKAAK